MYVYISFVEASALPLDLHDYPGFLGSHLAPTHADVGLETGGARSNLVIQYETDAGYSNTALIVQNLRLTGNIDRGHGVALLIV